MNTYLNSLTGDQAHKSNYNSSLSSIKEPQSPALSDKLNELFERERDDSSPINDRQRFKNMIKSDKKIRFKLAGLIKRKE